MAAPRPKMGETGIDWKQYAFGKGKYRRKTFGFGVYNKKERQWSDLEIYIRELSIVDAGIGCAVWDASIIFSRWIYKNREVFRGQRVIELGAGCGLPGLLAAHYSQSVVLSDYIPQIFDNLQYNVRLNFAKDEDADESRGDDESIDAGGDSGEARGDATAGAASSATTATAAAAAAAPAAGDAADNGSATTAPTPGKAPFTFKNLTVQSLNWDDETTYPAGDKFDMIIGSELTYSTLSIHSLAALIPRLLRDDGVFYEVLSDDRDGVGEFLALIRERGFECRIHPVPPEMLGSYGTGQRPETYKLYTFARPGCRHPDMS